jgi:CheY-like chemotaxis protein
MHAQTAEPPSSRACVLFVEDDGDVREAVSGALEDEGYDVVGACDGVDALEHLGSGLKPQLIILDLSMPRMAGPELRQELAREPALEQVPVVVMSADAGGRKQANAMGAWAFLKKPINLQQLFATIARALKR